MNGGLASGWSDWAGCQILWGGGVHQIHWFYHITNSRWEAKSQQHKVTRGSDSQSWRRLWTHSDCACWGRGSRYSNVFCGWWTYSLVLANSILMISLLLLGLLALAGVSVVFCLSYKTLFWYYPSLFLKCVLWLTKQVYLIICSLGLLLVATRVAIILHGLHTLKKPTH